MVAPGPTEKMAGIFLLVANTAANSAGSNNWSFVQFMGFCAFEKQKRKNKKSVATVFFTVEIWIKIKPGVIV